MLGLSLLLSSFLYYHLQETTIIMTIITCIIFTLICYHDCSHHHHHHCSATTINLSYILIHHVQSNALIFWFFIFYIDYSTHKNCIFRRSESLERTLKQRDVPRQRAASYSPPAKK